ncbi:hypothetical protein JKP88DRAFT_253894 [Tribonema minus]|uniref:DEAD/DEAH-box helicase domain-containing protein n=1 Tax=Tribonema minus TaxID=303371 RepID=A0A835Z8P2_9STRA|nr:hypothetical protein JKP88DRAFT_253894 [Tribonema minus]
MQRMLAPTPTALHQHVGHHHWRFDRCRVERCVVSEAVKNTGRDAMVAARTSYEKTVSLSLSTVLRLNLQLAQQSPSVVQAIIVKPTAEAALRLKESTLLPMVQCMGLTGRSMRSLHLTAAPTVQASSSSVLFAEQRTRHSGKGARLHTLKYMSAASTVTPCRAGMYVCAQDGRHSCIDASRLSKRTALVVEPGVADSLQIQQVGDGTLYDGVRLINAVCAGRYAASNTRPATASAFRMRRTLQHMFAPAPATLHQHVQPMQGITTDSSHSSAAGGFGAGHNSLFATPAPLPVTPFQLNTGGLNPSQFSMPYFAAATPVATPALPALPAFGVLGNILGKRSVTASSPPNQLQHWWKREGSIDDIYSAPKLQLPWEVLCGVLAACGGQFKAFNSVERWAVSEVVKNTDRDAMLVAPAGYGKTFGLCLSTAMRLNLQLAQQSPSTLQAIILTPTADAALRLRDSTLLPMVQRMGLPGKVLALGNERDPSGRATIVIGTPEMVSDWLSTRDKRAVVILCVDAADQLGTRMDKSDAEAHCEAIRIQLSQSSPACQYFITGTETTEYLGSCATNMVQHRRQPGTCLVFRGTPQVHHQPPQHQYQHQQYQPPPQQFVQQPLKQPLQQQPVQHLLQQPVQLPWPQPIQHPLPQPVQQPAQLTFEQALLQPVPQPVHQPLQLHCSTAAATLGNQRAASATSSAAAALNSRVHPTLSSLPLSDFNFNSSAHPLPRNSSALQYTRARCTGTNISASSSARRLRQRSTAATRHINAPPHPPLRQQRSATATPQQQCSTLPTSAPTSIIASAQLHRTRQQRSALVIFDAPHTTGFHQRSAKSIASPIADMLPPQQQSARDLLVRFNFPLSLRPRPLLAVYNYQYTYLPTKYQPQRPQPQPHQQRQRRFGAAVLQQHSAREYCSSRFPRYIGTSSTSWTIRPPQLQQALVPPLSSGSSSALLNISSSIFLSTSALLQLPRHSDNPQLQQLPRLNSGSSSAPLNISSSIFPSISALLQLPRQFDRPNLIRCHGSAVAPVEHKMAFASTGNQIIAPAIRPVLYLQLAPSARQRISNAQLTLFPLLSSASPPAINSSQERDDND